MKVLVSSCITGKNCKYNGGNNLNTKVVEFLKDKNFFDSYFREMYIYCVKRWTRWKKQGRKYHM